MSTTKPTAADRIAVLETTVALLTQRLDAASAAFKVLRDEIKVLRAPKVEPRSLAPRIARAAFDRALEDLRSEAAENGSTQRVWPRDAILQRAETLATMEANTAAAAE